MIRTLQHVIDTTKEVLLDKFPSKEKYADEIISVILARVLTQFKLDLSKKSFFQIYQEYTLPLETLESEDLTKKETLPLINESKLTERNYEIAYAYYIERKSEDTIAQELCIDKKTVHANLPKISTRLKRTAVQMYRSILE